jgi:hypothetical protein
VSRSRDDRAESWSRDASSPLHDEQNEDEPNDDEKQTWKHAQCAAILNWKMTEWLLMTSSKAIS